MAKLAQVTNATLTRFARRLCHENEEDARLRGIERFGDALEEL